MLKIYRKSIPESFQSSYNILTLGSFDTLHLGHQSILERLSDRKDELREKGVKKVNTILLTFYPNPKKIITDPNYKYLFSLNEKVDILKKFNLNLLYLVKFDLALSKIGAEEFVNNFLLTKANIAELFIGPDAAVGHKREGDVDFLQTMLRKREIPVNLIDFKKENNKKISTRNIKALIADGKLEEAKKQLGRDYNIIGRVVTGDSRGKSLGFPTANISYNKNKLLPPNGIYSGFFYLNGKKYLAACNIGISPTFTGEVTRVEAHLPDYKGTDFYGSKVELKLTKKIRDEVKYTNIEDLKRQIELDIKIIKESLT